MTVFTYTNLCKDRRNNRRQTSRFTHLIWTLEKEADIRRWKKKDKKGTMSIYCHLVLAKQIAKNNMQQTSEKL